MSDTTWMKRRVTDDMAWVGDMLSRWVSPSYTINGQFVDLEKFDVVPKQNYLDNEIKRVDQELDSLQRQQDMATKYYENKRAILLEEKERYKRQKTNSG